MASNKTNKYVYILFEYKTKHTIATYFTYDGKEKPAIFTSRAGANRAVSEINHLRTTVVNKEPLDIRVRELNMFVEEE